MSSNSRIRRVSVMAALAFAFGAVATLASAQQFRSQDRTPPPPVVGGFKAKGSDGSTKGHVETCNNAASCNLMISYCISHGGDWQETGIPTPEGRPQKGKCTYS